MRPQRILPNFLLKERLLLVSVVGLVVTSCYSKRPPSYSTDDIHILFILAVLLIAVKGLEGTGLMARLSRRIEKGPLLPLKLVCATFFFSMFVTNDAALIVIVPLTLALETDRKDTLVILEALAANAGSALTPFGNPQNLFIYWHYGIEPGAFVLSIAPFSLGFLALISLASLFVRTLNERRGRFETPGIKKTVFIYGALFLIVVSTILRILRVEAGAVVLIYTVLFDRKALRIDYSLLLTLFCFFGISENMRSLVSSSLEHGGHIFVFSALAS